MYLVNYIIIKYLQVSHVAQTKNPKSVSLPDELNQSLEFRPLINSLLALDNITSKVILNTKYNIQSKYTRFKR